MNPLILLGAIPSALAVGALAWLLHGWDVGRIEANQAKALTEQATALQEQCNQQKENTANAAKEANNRLSDLQRKLDAPRVRYTSKCVSVPRQPSPAGNGEAKPDPLIGPYGLSVDFLRDNSAEGSKYQIQLGVLQKFVCSEWQRLKQPTDGLCP